MAGGGHGSMDDAHVIEIERLLNTVGDVVLHRDLDFKVRRDEVMTLVGGSGSGKTQLLRVILGLKRPAGGTVRVLLDREKDKLAFEFIPAAEAKPRAPRTGKKKSEDVEK